MRKLTPEEREVSRKRNHERAKAWRKANPERARAIARKAARKNYKANPQKMRLIARQWAKNNSLKVKERQRRYYAENREAILNRKKQWHVANRERNLERNKDYCQRTAEHRKILARRYRARHRKLKTNNYFACLLRNSLLSALAGKNKSNSALRLLGCPLDLFRLHIQNQFRDGMAWNNHGTHWHIDHIKPCASFDLSDPEQQKICFHYSNMQPLLVVENLRKGDRVTL